MNDTRRRYGSRMWAFGAGHIPPLSTGKEPEFTSHDKIAILNFSDSDAEIILTIIYEHDQPPIEYRLKVPSQRIRKVRFNDLIDPIPLPLNRPFGFILNASVEVIVQFSRLNSVSAEVAGFCVTPFYKASTP